MGWQTLPGSGLVVPAYTAGSETYWSSANSALMDAAGEKAGFIGRVWYPGTAATKNIVRVHVRFGTVNKAGGSGLTLSLQDAAGGAVTNLRPDDVQDQTVAISNAQMGTGVWHRSGTLSASRTVACGDLLAVVIEWDALGRQGSDNLYLSSIYGSMISAQSYMISYTGAWTNAGQWHTGHCLLEFDDGTYGIFEGHGPYCSLLGETSFNSSSTPNEYALRFSFPWDVKLNMAQILMGLPASNDADFDVVLYEGTTPLKTWSIDANQVGITNSRLRLTLPMPDQTLSKDTYYYLSLKPTQSSQSIRCLWADHYDAGHMLLNGGTENWLLATRSGGAWSTTALRRPGMHVRLAAIDMPSGGVSRGRQLLG